MGRFSLTYWQRHRGLGGNPGRAVIEALRGEPNTYAWPSNEDLELAFSDGRYYGPGGINQDRLRLLLGAIDERLQIEATKSEDVVVEYQKLQIEHIIPQGWRDEWPVTISKIPLNERSAEFERQQHINRIGNLTLVAGPLNASMGNDPWDAKRAALQQHTVLGLQWAVGCRKRMGRGEDCGAGKVSSIEAERNLART